MNPQTILEIIKLILEIWKLTLEGIPIESRKEIWLKNEAHLKFWTDLFEGMNKS